MFCMYCGKELPDNASFCAFCGKKMPVVGAGDSIKGDTNTGAFEQKAVLNPESSEKPKIKSRGFEEKEQAYAGANTQKEEKKSGIENWDGVPDYAFYIFSKVFPYYKFGANYCIVDESSVSPYLDSLIKDPVFDVVKISYRNYLVTMGVKDLFKMLIGLGMTFTTEEFKEYTIYRKYVSIEVFKNFIETRGKESPLVCIFSNSKDHVNVFEGIRYLGLNLTLQEAISIIEKYNYGVRCGGDIISSQEALNIYNSKGRQIEDMFKDNATGTGVLIQICKM